VTTDSQRARSLLARSWLMYALILMLGAQSAVIAYVRNRDTRHLSECTRLVIRFDDRNTANEIRFWQEVSAAGQNRKRALAAFTLYRKTQLDIQREKRAALANCD
jgi:hypothetical protein